MLRLKRQYEMAVEQRNYTGTHWSQGCPPQTGLDWTGLDWTGLGSLWPGRFLSSFCTVTAQVPSSSATIRSSPVPHSHR